MSDILDLNLGDVPDLKAIDAGEYELTVTSAKKDKSKSGNDMLSIVFRVNDVPNTLPIFHYMTLPSEDDDPEIRNSKLRRIKAFYQAFGVDVSSPVDVEEDLPGLTGFALLRFEEATDEFEERNSVKRFVTPK